MDTSNIDEAIVAPAAEERDGFSGVERTNELSARMIAPVV